MSDKSFGDHTNRNIVKNPLLSSAVTGLSLEDLTHKAILLPVTPSLGQITRSDQQGSQTRTLAHSEHEKPAFPSGDAFSNIALTNTPQISSQKVLDSKNNVKLEKNHDKQSLTQSKASLKTDDDFDVNEYIARLQGSRYVSAPLHSHLKEDQNANLETTEENLEEINLNESRSPVEVQQSLTADIAQNFSQLPTVLPHVASAVFSSFSNMLSYKSREQTPDPAILRANDQRDNRGGYDEVQFQRPETGAPSAPMTGMENYGAPKEVAPPPKEPPIGGISNFRISTKKKYAQIPGLSSGDAQTMTFNAPGQNIPIGQSLPLGQSMPQYAQNVSFAQTVPPIGKNTIGQGIPPTGQSIPPIDQSIPPIGQRILPIGQNIPPIGQSVPPIGQRLPAMGQSMPPMSQSKPAIGQNMPPMSQVKPPMVQSMPPMSHGMLPIGQNKPPMSQSMPPMSHGVPPMGQSKPVGQNVLPFGQNMPESQSIPTIFNPNEAKIDNSFRLTETGFEGVKSYESNVNTQSVAESQSQYNIFSPATENKNVSGPLELPANENQLNLFAAAKDSQSIFTPIETKKEQAPPPTIPTNSVPGNTPIIPPPPMFSNLPKKDSQSSVGKSILPPSVARRISANQPIIKSAVSTPSFTENIFVPTPVSEATECSGQFDNNAPAGFSSSAFMPTCTTSLKSDPIDAPRGIPPPAVSQTTTYFIPSNEEKSKTSTQAPTFFSPKEMPPLDSSESKVRPPLATATATPTLPKAIPTSAFPPVNLSSFRTTESNIPTSNVGFANTPQASFIFTPENIDVTSQSAAPTSMFRPPPQNLPPPPMLFNPLQQTEALSKNAPHSITQMPPMANPEPKKPSIEPPKAAGNVSFRMTNKRPQYYAGPIEGVGAISNNVKPTLAPVIPSATLAEASNFQSTLFTPEQPSLPFTEQYTGPNIEQASVPFDVSRPEENNSLHTPFDLSKPQEQQYTSLFNISQPETQNYGQEYNTAFDMSRATTETYALPKQESKGFGIIGSLKSKLSSIDINKIQSTVTTFFDPAYNEGKAIEPVVKDNLPYGHQQQYDQQHQFGQTPQGQSNFDIFVPNAEQNQYSQFKEIGYDYSANNQCYQTQDTYAIQTQAQNIYSTSSYFTNPNYSTEQVYSGNPLYDNTQPNFPTVCSNTYIPEKVKASSETAKSIDSTTFCNPNVLTHESTIKPIGQQQSFDTTSQIQDQAKSNEASGVTETSSQSDNIFTHDNTKLDTQQYLPSFSETNFETQKSASVSASEKAPNIAYYNPNVYVTENLQKASIPQQSFDLSERFSQTNADHDDKSTVSALGRSQEQVFYNPNMFSIGNQQETSNVFRNEIQYDLASNIHELTRGKQIESQSYDSALNTSKYNMSSIQKPPMQPNMARPIIPLLPAANFFDMPHTANLTQFSKDNETEIKMSTQAFTKNQIQLDQLQEEQFEATNLEIDKILSETPIPVVTTKSLCDLATTDDQNKHKEMEREQLLKERNLIESLSKDDIPILGVSTVPLFGLSAMIAEKSREISESENEVKNASFFDSAQQSRNAFEGAIDSFQNVSTEKKFISESQLKDKPLDITALSITDVKNVLVIEPPQENIGALLKRTISSNKLESMQKTVESSPEHSKQQNNNLPSTIFQEKFKIQFDENASNTFFIHSDTETKDLDKATQKDISTENQDKNTPELNICETCREVTPDVAEHGHKESEDLTTHLIENITSRVQLSNPLTVPFTESDAPVDERSQFDDKQFEEIAHVAEETIETLHVQSATELLDDQIITNEAGHFRWTSENAACTTTTNIDHDYGTKIDSDAIVPKTHAYDLRDSGTIPGDDYKFKIDPNSIGFFGDNSLLFDHLPTNASDEIKAEIKHSHEDIVLPRQMSIPSAPPLEDVAKLEETGILDVNSIEQDAKKDFPLEEEFIIEPSTDDFLSTDDDKIELRERKRSSEDSTSNDTFTNRVERFKKAIDNPNDDAFEQKKPQVFGSPPMSMASYFDTGNYAVESHYRNSLSSPTSVNTFQFTGNVMRIPPGFEEEYARRLSGMSLSSGENKNEPQIPETSTQTSLMTTLTYASSHVAEENVIGFEMRQKENAEAFAEVFEEKNDTNQPINLAKTTQIIDNPIVTADPVQIVPSSNDSTSAQPELFTKNVQPLPDPMKFFSANVDEAKQTPETAAPESFNRLASYFSMPPPQPEHSKSFFELSQSQNHYRHETKVQKVRNEESPFFELRQNHDIDDCTKTNIKDLMHDLISPQNIQEQIIKTVNYFTVEYENIIKQNSNAAPINVKISDESNLTLKTNAEKKAEKLVENDSKDFNEIISCRYCLSNKLGIDTKDFNVRTATNENSEPKKETANANMSEKDKTGKATSNLANYDIEGQSQDGVTVLTENRASWEYTPVKHHWFYRIDVEEKSVWRGFSLTDSQALEDAYHSPDLNESTLVATDGGRYDVNVMGRLRIAVYWKEKPTNVRRCSWFYKGTTDARYVPYTEAVAEKLEEEYRHGVTTGEWHRKLSLPNNEMVIMHGSSVMVHFLHSTTDAFSAPPNLLGKYVYRNPPKIRVAKNQEPVIDHLILLVHGAGEYKRGPYLDQTTTRPRVVRRSHEESEIEDCEPSRIDHLLLLCHGVGSACDMRFRSVEEVVEDFRATTLQLLQSHYKNSYDNGIVSRVEVLPISWHDQLHSGEGGVDKRLSRVTLDSIPRLRAFTNHTVLDVLFYTSPVFHQTIIDTVCSELNRVYRVFQERNPMFRGGVSLGGHSLGSVILYDLLCHQTPKSPIHPKSTPDKTYVAGTNAKDQPVVKYPQLVFPPAALYALGSPIAIFECIRGVESLGIDFALPTCKNFFNIFHPYDPIAYRIEPLINPQLQEVKPSQIPHHKGRKRMHLELKDTMARVGADLKQKLVESLRTTWNKWTATPPPEGQLEKVVEEEMEKEQLREEDQTAEVQITEGMLGHLNSGRRIDYVLQEAPLEMINEYLFAMTSHVGYWESEDTMLLMLREIYSTMGVQPDSTVPQQSMTVQRTRTVSGHDETSGVSESDYPSTSRGGT